MKPIQELFKDNPNSKFRLIQILDINLKQEPYKYIVICQDQNKEYHLTLVQPEHLFDKYKIGMTYQNDEEIDIIGTDYSVFGIEKPNLEGLEIQKDSFYLQVPEMQSIYKLSNVITDNDSKLITDESLYKEFLEQYCQVYQMEEYDLIIPCSTIANKYYLFTRNFAKAIFNGIPMNNIHYKQFYKKIDDKRIEIHLKNTFGGIAFLTDICRFISDDYAHNQLKYFSTQRLMNEKEFFPIKALFPLFGPLNIEITYVQVNSADKPKYFVLNILKQYSKPIFSKIYYQVHHKSIDTHINRENMEVLTIF